MPETETETETKPAWGSFELPSGSRARLRVGPLTLWVERTPHEWLLASKRDRDASDELGDLVTDWPEPPPDSADQLRCAAGTTGHALRTVPALADRPIVIRPEQPFALLAGDEAVFYFGTPLWVRLLAGDPARILVELPGVRPSDTWFGPSTREGELCYAAKTRARMDLAEISPSPARALTRIHLRNTASQTLNFARIKIPIAQLGLFLAADGRHWTEGLRVDIEAEEVECRVDASAPAEAGEVARVADARSQSPGVFRRTLAALLG